MTERRLMIAFILAVSAVPLGLALYGLCWTLIYGGTWNP